MIRRISRIRVRPRRKGRPSPAPEEELVGAVLTAEQVALKAQLHEQAAQTVCATLERMQRRAHEAARTNPDLGPYLSAYFEASRRSLLEHTLAILDDYPAQQPAPHEQPIHRPRWRFPLHRLLLVHRRKEHPNGAA